MPSIYAGLLPAHVREQREPVPQGFVALPCPDVLWAEPQPWRSWSIPARRTATAESVAGKQPRRRSDRWRDVRERLDEKIWLAALFGADAPKVCTVIGPNHAPLS